MEVFQRLDASSDALLWKRMAQKKEVANSAHTLTHRVPIASLPPGGSRCWAHLEHKKLKMISWHLGSSRIYTKQSAVSRLSKSTSKHTLYVWMVMYLTISAAQQNSRSFLDGWLPCCGTCRSSHAIYRALCNMSLHDILQLKGVSTLPTVSLMVGDCRAF